MTENDATHAIIFGADMEPERIRKQPETAGARFVGIGAVDAHHRTDPDLPLPDVPEVWGVVLRLEPGTTVEGRTVPVTLRTGEHVEAVVLTEASSLADRDAVLAEARYWELPVAYREALSRDEAER